MISTLVTLWLIGLASIMVLRRNPSRAKWVDNVYEVIYLPVINFLQSMRNKFLTKQSVKDIVPPSASLSTSNNSRSISEKVELQFQLKNGLWITENFIEGPLDAHSITQALNALLRQKAGTSGYAGRVRAVGTASGQIYEIR